MQRMNPRARKDDVGLDINKLLNPPGRADASGNPGYIRETGAEDKQNSSKHTIFAPRNGSSAGRGSHNSISLETQGPEKKLTLFALRLAVLEKAATGLGALGFVWATVVLLGGFADALETRDFWYITIILVIESARIFSRSHELEWQNQATWTVTHAGISSLRSLISTSRYFVGYLKAALLSCLSISKRREFESENTPNQKTEPQKSNDDCMTATPTEENSNDPLLTRSGWAFISTNVSKALYWLQILSAVSSVVLSLIKLIKRDYGIDKRDIGKSNLFPSLVLFYSLALAEGLLFLVEKAYWEWEISICNLLERVNRKCKLGPIGVIAVRRFFYDAYSKCVHGSIFDGLKMDMVTFAMNLLDSINTDEQLIAARILRQFATNEPYARNTLLKIGINKDVIERLVEILNWRSPQQEEMRESAAEILLKLADKKQNSLRVTDIPGAMESISSLLQSTRSSSDVADEIGENKIVHDDGSGYNTGKFNNIGLLILKRLARDPENCAKFGNTRGLLPKIVDFTHVEERLLKEENPAVSQMRTVKRALQLLKMLASTTGATGDYLRGEISEIVFTISNMRDMLSHGDKHPKLQKLSIQILTSLALQDDATEIIGGTGGILKELFDIFFRVDASENQDHVQTIAGEALAMLALESTSNCHRILKLEILEKLMEALEIPLLRVTAARILRNLCAYTASEFYHQLERVKTSSSTVLNAIMSEESKLQEVMIGLAAYVFKFMSLEEYSNMFRKSKIEEYELAEQLVCILKMYQRPSTKVPRMRRFTIELIILMMEHNAMNVKTFKNLGVDRELQNVLRTTAELENFDIFSGTTGVTRHPTAMHELVEEATKILE